MPTQVTSLAYKDLGCFCEWSSTLVGTANFIVGSAQPGKYQPEQVQVIDGNSYDYYAQAADGSQWENGSGVYSISTHTLTRATIVDNSDNTLVPLNFTNFPLVSVLAGDDLIVGFIAPLHLGSNPSSTTFLAGDNTYKIVKGSLISKVYYTASQTITIPPNATQAEVFLGAPGGGSGGNNSGAGSDSGGGGSGSYLEKLLTGLTPGNTLALVMGALGVAGIASGGTGGTGGNCTLSSGTQSISTLTVFGGGGSLGNTGNNGLAGALSTGGDLNMPGMDGDAAPFNGTGSATLFAAGGAPVGISGGGGHGGHGQASSQQPGKPGLPGVCIIKWLT